MYLTEVDWDAPGGAANVQVEYPDDVIAEFVNWARKTTAWLENPDIMERRVRKLNRDLSEWRAARGQNLPGTVMAPFPGTTPSVAEKRRAGLAKARAAKAAKKLQEASHG